MFKKKPFLFALFCLLPSSAFFASNLKIPNMFFQDNHLYITVVSDFTNFVDLDKIIADGIEIEASYQIYLYRKTGVFIPDDLVSKDTVLYKAKKDFFNNGYELIEYSRDSEMSMWFYKIEELKYFLMNLERVRVINLEKLNQDAVYYAEVQLVVTSLKLYPPLSVIFNLFGKWNYTSPKIRSREFNRHGIIPN